jgi:DNA-damage-inducible protein J
MAMTSINVRVDEHDKQLFDNFCSAIGMNISTAFNMFIKATLREQKISFELKTDPYFTGANMRHIMKGIQAYKQGIPGIVKTFEDLEPMENV